MPRKPLAASREAIPVRPTREELPTGQLYRHHAADHLRRVANLCLSCKHSDECTIQSIVLSQEKHGIRTMITSCRSWEDRRE